MKIEISTFNEEIEYYEHYGYYDSISEAISDLTRMYISENFTEEQQQELFNGYEIEQSNFRRGDESETN